MSRRFLNPPTFFIFTFFIKKKNQKSKIKQKIQNAEKFRKNFKRKILKKNKCELNKTELGSNYVAK